MMFHSSQNAGKINELRAFLQNVARNIISSPDIQSKSYKNRSDFIPGYTLVYDMCNEKPSLQQKMLQEYKNSLSYFIETYIDMSQLSNPFRFGIQNSRRVIQWFNILWLKYIKFMICVSKKVFAYLDRYYLPGTQQHSLYKVGLRLYKKNVCHENNMRFFQNCFFKLVRQMRDNKIIDNNQLLKFSQAIAIVDHQQLISSLTKRYLEQTQSYFNSFYKLNNKLTSIQYFSKIYNMLLFQQTLIKMTICLNPFEIARFFIQYSKILVQQYTQLFCGQQSSIHGLRKMFQTKNIQFMKVVNEIYRRFQGFDKIKQAYYEYLLEQGEKILQKYKNNNNPLAIKLQQSLLIVDDISSFYKNHLLIITQGFNRHNELFVTLNNAIQKIISRQQHFSAILYLYCSKSRKQGTFQINKQKITLLFQKILSKDQFVASYQSQLFKKITSNQINLSKQQQFVCFLNQICGSQVTYKLVKKIKDINDVPKTINIIKALPNNIQFNITVLSFHLWQKKFLDQVSLNISLPQPLQSLWKTIQKNYIQLEPKKKLISLPFQNKLNLQVKFNKKLLLMKCNLIQASIFTYLSSKSYTSEQDLIINLRIQKNVVQTTMQAFESIPNLLLKTTLGDYIVNWYYDQSENVIDLVSKHQQSNKQMQKAIKQDREILIEAAIVKYIKRAKHTMFEQIVQGVVKAIRLFKPLPQVIKASVDKLLKKGFLQQKQGGVLEYVQ